MKTALLLHSISEAKYAIQRHLHEGCLVFSTNPSVDVFLKEAHGLECVCVSRFLTRAELLDCKVRASKSTDRLLASLDARIAPTLNSELGLRMRYFEPLYSYYGKLHLLAHASLVTALRRIVSDKRVTKFRFSASRYQKLLNADSDLESLFIQFIPDVVREVFDFEAPGPADREGVRFRRALRKLSDLDGIRGALSEVSARLRMLPRDPTRKTLLFVEPLYYLDFLKREFPRFNVIRCSFEGRVVGWMREKRAPLPSFDRDRLAALLREKNDDPLETVLLRAVEQDFLSGVSRYVEPVLRIQEIHRKTPIAAVIWGNIGGYEKCMLIEYLRSVGVTRVGAQHGNCYVDQVQDWTIDSDFNRCDHFISWGFDRDDFERAFPRALPELKIHPLGIVRPAEPAHSKTAIDVVYPLSLSIDMFDGGPAKMRPHVLSDRQVKILEYLNSAAVGRKVFIKPFPLWRPEHNAVFPILRKLKNLTVINEVFFDRFMEEYGPKAVVVDYPTSPLFQALHHDAEIFLMPDEVNPYEERALEELKRRVHYCEDEGELIAKLDLFFEGRLEKKRDESYYGHYVHRPNARENTLRLIEDLANKE